MIYAYKFPAPSIASRGKGGRALIILYNMWYRDVRAPEANGKNIFRAQRTVKKIKEMAYGSP